MFSMQKNRSFYTSISLLSCSLILLIGCSESPKEVTCEPIEVSEAHKRWSDSISQILKWPKEIEFSGFAGPDVTPSPSCLAVAPNGDVFVGIDMIGSLGKKPGNGSILKLRDCNNDGVTDSYTTFATLDNPRGIQVIGDQVFVLHTTFSEITGIATGMSLVVFEDKDKDGIADGAPTPLIRNISSKKFLQSRGTDHATNGIRLGIDGWIYIAVGDFGFHGAVDASGKAMTMLGGGILRVRPNGTEMEVYTHGLRNIYDVAIDPFMNIYTRGNTNDGGGWNIRFIHQIQSGEYGYPVLFKHFTNEILPALVDVGGGSGTGSLFMNDPNWPESLNNVPMMADWGRSQLVLHRVEADQASFTQKDEVFLKLPQITDVDVDASGRMFMAAWDGAGYSGSPNKGYVVRAIPKGLEFKEFPDLHELSTNELAELLKSKSGKARLHAQQALLKRSKSSAASVSLDLANDTSLTLENRVAALFTYSQVAGISGIDNLISLTKDASVQEFALRALADRKSQVAYVPATPFIEGLKSSDPRVQVAAIVGLGRLENPALATELLKIKVPKMPAIPAEGIEGAHATPNAKIIPAHLAVRALVSLNAVDACVNALGTEQTELALWALKYMHSEKAVTALISYYKQSPKEQDEIITTLARLYHKEAPYDGSWWWSTRPDTHGPYYKSIPWEASSKIRRLITSEWAKAKGTDREAFFISLDKRDRLELNASEIVESGVQESEIAIDLESIKNKKGEIGKASIENIMLAIAEIPGDPLKGKKLFTQQGCVACHSTEKGETLKGPFMGQIGSIMNREQIAESIIKPNASISQGFASVYIETKDGKGYSGFISEETAKKLVLRTITGQVFTINSADIKEREELETSMMPSGLANSLSLDEFASLVTYLSTLKK